MKTLKKGYSCFIFIHFSGEILFLRITKYIVSMCDDSFLLNLVTFLLFVLETFDFYGSLFPKKLAL